MPPSPPAHRQRPPDQAPLWPRNCAAHPCRRRHGAHGRRRPRRRRAAAAQRAHSMAAGGAVGAQRSRGSPRASSCAGRRLRPRHGTGEARPPAPHRHGGARAPVGRGARERRRRVASPVEDLQRRGGSAAASELRSTAATPSGTAAQRGAAHCLAARPPPEADARGGTIASAREEVSAAAPGRHDGNLYHMLELLRKTRPPSFFFRSTASRSAFLRHEAPATALSTSA